MWNERYSAEGYVYGTEPNTFLREHADLIPFGPILSLCEGEGRNAVFLARKGFAVTAVDGSEVGLQKAQALALQNNVTLTTQVVDMADFTPPANTYGAVISIFAHVPAAVRARMYRLAMQSLKDNGILIIEAYTPQQFHHNTGGPKELDRLVSLSNLQQELAGCEFLLARETERDISEGKFHTGIGHVVQVVAKRNRP